MDCSMKLASSYENHLAQMRDYYRRKRSERLDYARSYYEENRGRILAAARTDRLEFEFDYKSKLKDHADRGDVYFHTHARERTLMRRATPSWYNVEPIKELFRQCVAWNDQHPMEYHVGHIIPIRGYKVCGLHVHWNMRLATKSFMMASKFDQDAASAEYLRWLKQQGL